MGGNDDDVRRAPTTASRRSGTPSTPARCWPTPASRRREQHLATAAPAGDAATPRQGVLGRRHGADLHQPRRTRPGGGQRSAGPRQLRGRPQPDHRRVPEPDRPGQPGQAGRRCEVMKKEELATSTAPTRCTRAAAATSSSCSARRTSSTRRRRAQRIAFSQFFGQHGYLPTSSTSPHNVNMHATFIAAGPGIRKQATVAGVRAIDVAPTSRSCWASPARRTPAARSCTSSSRRARAATRRSRSSTSATTTASWCRSPRRRTTCRAGASTRVRHRRVGVPEAVVRRVPRRGARTAR